MIRYKYLYLVASCVILTLTMQVSVFGEVRNVYESDGAQGIQDSINVSGAGDTVLVHDGIYYVRDIDSLGITMRDSIVFMSVNGAESCTLSGLNNTATDTAYHVICCDSASFGDSSSRAAMIKGFTITGGNANGYFWPDDCGGGIYCNSSSPTIESCMIINNEAYQDGGGLYIRQSCPTIADNVIENNDAFIGSGLCVSGSSPIITNNTISNNHPAFWGGGLHIRNYSFPVITNNTVDNNSARYGGGFSIINNSSPTLKNNTIMNNFGDDYGGGLYITDNSSPEITNSTIVNNSADIRGGGLCIMDNSSPTLIDNTIENNSTNYWNGGGLYIRYSSPTIVNNMVMNNSADDHGGGFYINQCSSTIHSNTIENNSASYGGGVCITSDIPGTINVTNNWIVNNSASVGGGGIYVNYASSTIQNNIIRRNSSVSGGGLSIFNYYCSPAIKNNTIENNLADCGGGVYIWDFSWPILTGNTIINNIANKGSAIYSTDSSKTVVDSCFIVDNGSIGNTKSGMTFIDSTSDILRVSNSHLYYNTFQPDTDIDNNTSIILPLENNFWWFIDSTTIQNLIAGSADIMPFEYDFISGVPGEPVSIDSVRNYDNDYSVIIDSLWDDPDTLYLRIYGEDRNTRFREAAVAIIKSSIYPSGIAVALIETDTSSGIYEGKAIVKTSTGNDSIRIDDIYQTVRVDSVCDSLQVVANMDTAQKFVVYYRICPGVEESESRSGDLSHTRLFQNYPNPFTQKTVIRVRFSCSDQHEPPARITIYDLSGRLVRILPIPQSPNNPITNVSWDGKDKNGKMVGSGVYFYKLEAGDFTKTKKMFLIK